jgi:DNA-binding transcriptional LysR family regulator
MELRQIRYTLTVARERSFTGASRRLNIAQSAISEQVKLLEQIVGFEIFYCTGRGVELTDRGRRFLREAERVENDVMNLAEAARRLRGVGVQTVTLGLASGLAAQFLPVLLSPDVVPAQVQLEIRTAPTRVLFEQLQEDRIDIGISAEVPHDRIPAGLIVTRLTDLNLVIIAHPDHPLARKGAPVDPGMLANEAIIMSETSLGYGEIVADIFADVGIRPRIRAIIDNVETMKIAVQAGLGLAVIPSGAADAEMRLGLLSMLPLRPMRLLTINAYRSRTAVSGRKAAILGRIVDEIEQCQWT